MLEVDPTVSRRRRLSITRYKQALHHSLPPAAHLQQCFTRDAQCARHCMKVIPLAIGATGVLQRAYGGKGRDGIGEALSYEWAKFESVKDEYVAKNSHSGEIV